MLPHVHAAMLDRIRAALSFIRVLGDRLRALAHLENRKGKPTANIKRSTEEGSIDFLVLVLVVKNVLARHGYLSSHHYEWYALGITERRLILLIIPMFFVCLFFCKEQ